MGMGRCNPFFELLSSSVLLAPQRTIVHNYRKPQFARIFPALSHKKLPQNDKKTQWNSFKTTNGFSICLRCNIRHKICCASKWWFLSQPLEVRPSITINFSVHSLNLMGAQSIFSSFYTNTKYCHLHKLPYYHYTRIRTWSGNTFRIVTEVCVSTAYYSLLGGVDPVKNQFVDVSISALWMTTGVLWKELRLISAVYQS